jgi:hypothetical protein
MKNPPAFPLTNKWNNQDYHGMTLRDYFAAKAMQRLMGKMHDSVFKTLKKSYKTVDAIEMSRGIIVDTAYEWADEMMKAREV